MRGIDYKYPHPNFGLERRHRVVCPYDGAALVRYGVSNGTDENEGSFGPPTCWWCGRVFTGPEGAQGQEERDAD